MAGIIDPTGEDQSPQLGILGYLHAAMQGQNLATPIIPSAVPGTSAIPPAGWQEFPRAGDIVSGMTVRDEIPNTSSIGASFNDYETLPGVREVPFSAFTQMGPLGKLDTRTKSLADEIDANQEINPLIVAMDKQGPYILEGGHRFDALRSLGKKTFPALVVRDLEDLNDR